MKLLISPKAPFDFELSLSYYLRSRFEVVDLVEAGNYYRLISCYGIIFPVGVRSSGRVNKPELTVQIMVRNPDLNAKNDC